MANKNLPNKHKLRYEFILSQVDLQTKENIFPTPTAVRWIRKNSKVHKRNKMVSTTFETSTPRNNNLCISYKQNLKQRFSLIFDPRISHFTHKTNEIQVLTQVKNKEKIVVSIKLELYDFIDLYELKEGSTTIEKSFGSYEKNFIFLKIQINYKLLSHLNPNVEKIFAFFKEDKHLLPKEDPPKKDSKKLSKKASTEKIPENNSGFIKYEKDLDTSKLSLRTLENDPDLQREFVESLKSKILFLENKIKNLNIQYVDFVYTELKLSKQITKRKSEIVNLKKILSHKKIETRKLVDRTFPLKKKSDGEREILMKIINENKKLNAMIEDLKVKGNKEENLKLLNKELESLDKDVKSFKEAIGMVVKDNEALNETLNSFDFQKKVEEAEIELEKLKCKNGKMDEMNEKQETMFNRASWNLVDEKTNLKEKKTFMKKIENELIEAKMKLAKLI